MDDHRRVVWRSDFGLIAGEEMETTGVFEPIFMLPTSTAPSSTTRPPASVSPKKRAVDRKTTVSLAWRLATNSPLISAETSGRVSGKRKRLPSGMISLAALRLPLISALL